jgi:epoxyqueuosine reductase
MSDAGGAPGGVLVVQETVAMQIELEESSKPVLAVLRRELQAQARTLGFDLVRIASPELPARARSGYLGFVEQGRHGEMTWLAREPERRADPRALWPEVKSVIVLGVNYAPAHDPRQDLERRERGVISVYAQARDYHDTIGKGLKALARWLADEHGAAVKVFVDTAPVLEKPLAEAAGLGWQGKHTNLVSRRFGSWLFLAEIFTDLELEPDPPEVDHCGSCRRCLDVCPTDAFPQAYQLDARRCISYLTIEHKGHIPAEFRAAIGNRIFGCDDCLAVCPWNKFARAANELRLELRADLEALALDELAALDDRTFRIRFAGTAVKRTGRDRFVRNVLIAIGNSGRAELMDAARARLEDASPLVRAAAVWALSRLLEPARFATLRRERASAEPDAAVLAEWRSAA